MKYERKYKTTGKLRATMIAKYGSEEAWREHLRRVGAKGGRASNTGGFYNNRKLAQKAARISVQVRRQKES